MKPIVTYQSNIHQFIKVGYSAEVSCIKNHPGQADGTLIGERVRTSKVIKFDESTGEFETMNTLYKPE